MKRFSMLLLVCLLVAGSIGTTVESAAGETKLLRNPDVSKDRIVFVYAGDLWTAAKSGGNATRFGVFGMLYGLHGSYWFPFLGARRGPVLIDELATAGYEFGIFGSASMNYPELRATAWAAIPDNVHDQFPGTEPWQRDEEAGAALIEFLEARPVDSAPFFSFLLLDSPHQTYSYPPERAPFQPAPTTMPMDAISSSACTMA